MKTIKAVGVIVFVFFAFFVLIIGYIIYSDNLPWPGDYPNSRWVYDGKYGVIELEVEDKWGYYKGTIVTENEKIYAEFAFDTMTRSIYILPLTQEEYDNDKGNPHTSQTILRGTFRCTKKAFTITSYHYNNIFGSEGLNPLDDEESPEIKLVLERVE